jgi:hypothetical protein
MASPNKVFSKTKKADGITPKKKGKKTKGNPPATKKKRSPKAGVW